MDTSQIRQVVMNLLTNAAEAHADRTGTIEVTTSLHQQWVVLEVKDQGHGIPQDLQAKIFDPFYTTKFTGRGLGLAAVQGIVQGHDGTIAVKSRVGQGTTFRVSIPVADDAPFATTKDDEQTPSAAPKWTGREQIMLVDDDEQVLRAMQRVLAGLDCEILLASSGQEALKIYPTKRRIDVVVMDMTMPGMSGEEAFLEIRRMDPTARVVLCSGYSEEGLARRFAGQGWAGFLQKPFEQRELKNRIENALEWKKGV